MPSVFGCDSVKWDVFARWVLRVGANRFESNLTGIKLAHSGGHGQHMAYGVIQIIGVVQLLAL